MLCYTGEPLAASSAAHESSGNAQQPTTRDQLAQLRAMLGAYQAAFQAAGLQLPALPSGSAINPRAAAHVEGHGVVTATQYPSSAHTSTMGGGVGPRIAAGILPTTVSGGEQRASEPTIAQREPGNPGSSGTQVPGSEDGEGPRSGGNKYVTLRSLGAPGPRDLGMEHVPSPSGAFTPRAPMSPGNASTPTNYRSEQAAGRDPGAHEQTGSRMRNRRSTSTGEKESRKATSERSPTDESRERLLKSTRALFDSSDDEATVAAAADGRRRDRPRRKSTRPLAETAQVKRSTRREQLNSKAAANSKSLLEMGFSPISAREHRAAQRKEVASAKKKKPRGQQMSSKELKRYQRKCKRELQQAIAESLRTTAAEELMHANIATRGTRGGDESLTPMTKRVISAQLREDDSSSDERARGVGLGMSSSESSGPSDSWTGEPGRRGARLRSKRESGTARRTRNPRRVDDSGCSRSSHKPRVTPISRDDEQVADGEVRYFSCYAVADPGKPTWGVYFDWDEVRALQPTTYKGFHNEHEARMWLESVDDWDTHPAGRNGVGGRPGAKPDGDKWTTIHKGRGRNAKPGGRRPPGPAIKSRGHAPRPKGRAAFRSWPEREKRPGPQLPQRSRHPYYAVARGHKTGIYTDWNVVRHMRPQRYQGFKTLDAARSWLDAVMASEGDARAPKRVTRQNKAAGRRRQVPELPRGPSPAANAPGPGRRAHADQPHRTSASGERAVKPHGGARPPVPAADRHSNLRGKQPKPRAKVVGPGNRDGRHQRSDRGATGPVRSKPPNPEVSSSTSASAGIEVPRWVREHHARVVLELTSEEGTDVGSGPEQTASATDSDAPDVEVEDITEAEAYADVSAPAPPAQPEDPTRTPSPLRWVDSGEVSTQQNAGERPGKRTDVPTGPRESPAETHGVEAAGGPVTDTLVTGSSKAAVRDMREFDRAHHTTLEDEVRRLRKELRDTRSQTQRDADKNRRDMEALVRRLTAEHVRSMARTAPFPFVAEVPSSIRPSSFPSESTSSGDYARNASGRRNDKRTPSDERKQDPDSGGSAGDRNQSDSDDDGGAGRSVGRGSRGRHRSVPQPQSSHSAGGLSNDREGSDHSDPKEEEPPDPGGIPPPGDEPSARGKAPDSDIAEETTVGADTGPAAHADDSDYSGDADRSRSNTREGGEAEGEPASYKGRPGVGASHAGKAGPSKPTDPAPDSGSRCGGLPKEAEPSYNRSDDVTIVQVISQMTESFLRAGDGKGGANARKRPECRRVPSVTDKRKLQTWREHRQWYLREVRLWNKVPGNVPMRPVPVIDLVSKSDWKAISQWELSAHHKTQPGQDPNDAECTNWVLGDGEYTAPINRVRGTQLEMLNAVRWPKTRSGETHLDRFYAYANRLDKVVRKIPGDQLTKHVMKARVTALRKELQPPRLRRLVHEAIEGGQDGRAPGEPTYNEEWHKRAYSDHGMTMGIVRSMCIHLDELAMRGFVPSGNGSLGTPQQTREVCKNFQRGKCRKGKKCKYRHVRDDANAGSQGKGPGEGSPTAAEKTAAEEKRKRDAKKAEDRNRDASKSRCRHDAAGRKCPHGEKCLYAHKNAKVNKVKPARARDDSQKICNACGERGHVSYNCDKLKKHITDIKANTTFKGDHAWFRDRANGDKVKELIRVRGWFARQVTGHAPRGPRDPSEIDRARTRKMGPAKEPDPDNSVAKAGPGDSPPASYSDKWVDAGWCSLGWGPHAIRLRLFIDLGAGFSFGPRNLYPTLRAKANAGELGAAHLASEMPQVEAQAWDGSRRKCKNWLQMCVQADNIAGTRTAVVGQLLSFDRESDENIIVAGIDLAQRLGYATPLEQRTRARAQAGIGVRESDLLGDDPPPRSWVLSQDCKAKIAANRKLEAEHTVVRAEALAYIGDYAFNNVRSCDVVMEPLLARSYVTSAVVTMAGESAVRKEIAEPSELAGGHMPELGAWLTGKEGDGAAGTVRAEVTMDVTRVLRDVIPLTRLQEVTFREVRSAEAKCVLGRDVLDRLECQDEDMPDPLQSDMGFDEEQEVENYLEAAMDKAKLEGLPKRHWARYRHLLFVKYKHVFRLRLGKEDPAILPPLEIQTIPGAKLRKGYTIPFNLPPDALDELWKEIKLNEGMGVIGDAPIGATLHNLLSIKKVKGGYRHVVTCVTANDITVDFHWFQPDNTTEQQSRMRGAKYFWLADMTKGYWQIRLHPNSRWLFCFATPFGAKQHLRAPMGSKATAPFFDMCMAKILDAAGLLRHGVEMIHDDHAGFASEVYADEPDGNSHFHLLRRYLCMCSRHRLRVSPKKFVLFSKEADIAGLLHRNGGLRPHPARYQGILDQRQPETVGDVYSCISAVGWSRSFIPNFAVLEQPMRSFVMEKLGTGKKTRRRADRMKLGDCPGWTPALRASYARLRLALIHAVKRSYRDYNKVSCLFYLGCEQVRVVLHYNTV